jgi:shikimate kinase
MDKKPRIVLTGFMGVGKSTVARCLAHILQAEKLDLDRFIESNLARAIPEIIETDGEERFREIETESLRVILNETTIRIISLGGGTWIFEPNRELIRAHNCITVWLASTFEHCWRNISASKQRRPIAKTKLQTQRLFDERQKVYCLADWHFVVEPQLTSFDIARRITEEIFD